MEQPHPLPQNEARRLALLSSRELEVLELTSAGHTNSEIARRLDVTVHAVKFHLGSIYRKLGVTNRTEAAIAFLQERATLGGVT
jgi:DNA-binding CsgD family transcriptional regulator